jgi:Ferritin-like
LSSPTQHQTVKTTTNQRAVVLGPGTTTEPPLPIDSREELVWLLTQACELEQGVLCEYLFALYTLKHHPQDGLSGGQLDQVSGWAQTITQVAVQEMLHLTLATNLLTALGAVPHLHRPNFPIRCQWYPPDVRLALVPFGESALRHFMYLERPDTIDLQDADAFAAICQCRPLTAPPAGLMAAPQAYHTVGHLYRSIEHGFERLVERYGEEDVFIGPRRAQARPEVFGWPQVIPVTDLASAQAAIELIVAQGEGAGGDWRDAHFGRFSSILDEFLEAIQADPDFAPARPARPAYVRRPPDQPEATIISDPRTAQVADLFDAAHQTMLQTLARCFLPGQETDQQLQTLLGGAVRLMAGVLRPLGSVLTTLPLGPDHPGEPAGPAFYMVHPSQVLLPDQQAAWTVIIQRLGELADACARLGLEPGLGQVAQLEPTIRTITASLHAHLDQRS